MPYRRIPSLNWLRVFEAAARSESFASAAKILNMSPAAVSQQIKALEEHLKTPLFERGPKNVSLTDAGLSFLPTVRQSLMSIEATAASIFGHPSGATVTLQSSLIFAASWLVDRLHRFEEQHPDIRVHIMGEYIDADFRRQGPDLYAMFGYPPNGMGDSDLLFGEVVFPVALPDIARTVVTPADLLKHTLIEISTHRTNWVQLFQSVDGLDMADARFYFTDTSEIGLTLAAAGHGIALARSPVTDARVRDFGLVPCLKEFQAEGADSFHLVCRSRNALSPAAQAFRAWLIEESGPYR